MAATWTKVKLKGDSQTIPRICPSCLAPSTTEWRYCYVRPFPLGFLDRTRYWQTFYYCDACSPGVQAFFGKEKVSGCLVPILFIAGLVGGLLLLIPKEGSNPDQSDAGKTRRGLAMAGAAVAAIALPVAGSLGVKAIYKGRAPQRPDQPVWGPSAYYIGDGWMGFGSADARVYTAVRPEWLKALVEANPAQVDEATYQRVAGTARPKPPEQKPFA